MTALRVRPHEFVGVPAGPLREACLTCPLGESHSVHHTAAADPGDLDEVRDPSGPQVEPPVLFGGDGDS